MKVSRERLQIIGRMIGVLREEKRQNKQNSWTQIKFCENICSPNTLKSIESGKVGRSDDIYEQLLDKLGLKYGEYPVIDEAVEQVVVNLKIAIEYYELNKLEFYTTKALQILDKAKDYVYYNELYKIISIIYSYYVKGEIIQIEESEHYLKLIDLFDVELKDILKLLIFAGIKKKCIGDVSYYTSCVKSLKLEKSNFSCAKLNLLQYYYRTNQNMKMLDTISDLEKQYIDNHNVIRLLDVYNCSIVLLSIVDRSYSQEYIFKVENLILNEQLPIDKISEAYANIASYFYNLKDFENALKYLNKSTQNGGEDILLNYILIADCQNQLGMQINIPELDKRIVKGFPHDIRVMYNYFLLYKDDEVPTRIKQKLLINKVAPLLEDDVNINIFLFELKKLIKETNSYKDLFTFEEIIEKNKKFF